MEYLVNALIWIGVTTLAIIALWMMATLGMGLLTGVVVGLHSLGEWLRARKRGYKEADPPADLFGGWGW